MIKKRLFQHIFILLLMVAVLHFFASIFYIYWLFPWFDIVPHFLSGGAVAMTIILFWWYFYPNQFHNRSKIILMTILGAFVIGILWETFEVYFSITFLSDGIAYVTDTSSDFLMDICGGFFGALYASNLLKKQ